MRLLSTRTGDFRWVHHASEVQYAVLSHVWSRDGEQSYQDILSLQAAVRAERTSNPDMPLDSVLRRASPKIRAVCSYAFKEGFEYVWMDFCCIDRTSSAEVSDAVNYMYVWYNRAGACYAYLDDVPDAEEDPSLPGAKFRFSQWHTRGWTLVELIAPKALTFLSSEWRALGTRNGLAEVLEEITSIDRTVLTHEKLLSSVSVARRMSWAAKRLTTRKEDEAYALLGLFGVNMSIMYGEGALAFIRLQEEILKQVADHSIFVWNAGSETGDVEESGQGHTRETLLASSPAAFARSAGVKPNSLAEQSATVRQDLPLYTATPHGMRSNFILLPVGPSVRLALLACTDEYGRRLALLLKKTSYGNRYSVGVAGWEATRARYRSSLRCAPWDNRPLGAGSTAEEEYTRIVHLAKPFPGTLPLSEIYITHRSMQPPYGDTETIEERRTDDLFHAERDGTVFGLCRWLCASVLNTFVLVFGVVFVFVFGITFFVILFALILYLTGTFPKLS